MSQENVDQEVLIRLENVEEKLNALSLFREQSKQLRDARMNLLNKITELKCGTKVVESRSKNDERRVAFTKVHTPSRTFVDGISEDTPRRSTLLANKSKSLQVLLTNLNSWQEELQDKKSTIELLKSRRQSLALTQHDKEYYHYEQKITELENERDELNEHILEFVLHNIHDGKSEYKNLIAQLELENADMEDKMLIREEQIQQLKDNNLTLVRENERLRNAAGLTSSLLFLKEIKFEIEDEKEESIISKKSFYDYLGETITPMLMEDEQSVAKDSADSFELDCQMTTWKMDEESLQENVKRLARDLGEMEIIQGKLELIKRYVNRHGTKYINRNTLIDPSKGMSMWHM